MLGDMIKQETKINKNEIFQKGQLFERQIFKKIIYRNNVLSRKYLICYCLQCVLFSQGFLLNIQKQKSKALSFQQEIQYECYTEICHYVKLVYNTLKKIFFICSCMMKRTLLTGTLKQMYNLDKSLHILVYAYIGSDSSLEIKLFTDIMCKKKWF